MIPALLLLAAAMPAGSFATSIEDAFWRACAEGQIAADAVNEVPPTSLSDGIRKRLGGETTRAFAINGMPHSLIVLAEFAKPHDGIVRSCAVVSTNWRGEDAWKAIYRRLWNDPKGPPIKVPAFTDAEIPVPQSGYAIRFDDIDEGGFAQTVFYDDATAKQRLAEFEMQKAKSSH